MKWIRVAFLFTVLLFAFTANAARVAPLVVSNPNVSTGLSGADLSTNPTTSTIKVKNFSLLKLQVRLTRGGAATDVSATCEESDDAITWSKITRITDDTVVEFNPTFATTVSVNFTIRPDVTGFVNVRCTFSGTLANSSDTIVVTGRLARGL